jgi:hypothetical protein
MTRRLEPADVAGLAALAGLTLPPDDLAPLAAALERHLAFVEPLLAAPLDDASPALVHDPRWRD